MVRDTALTPNITDNLVFRKSVMSLVRTVRLIPGLDHKATIVGNSGIVQAYLYCVFETSCLKQGVEASSLAVEL